MVHIFTFLKALGKSKMRIRAMSKKRPPKMKYPTKLENIYVEYYKSLVRSWKEIYLETIDQKLSDIHFQFTGKVDSWQSDLESIVNVFTLQANTATLSVIPAAKEMADLVSKFNYLEFQRTVQKVIGIPVYSAPAAMEKYLSIFTAQNVSLVTNLSQSLEGEINRVVQRGLQYGKSVKEIKKTLLGTDIDQGVFNRIETRAELIARDQVGKLNGQMTKIRQEDLGIDRYIWRTAMDERVRDSHEVLQGMLCQWNDGSIYSQNDGETWDDRDSIGAYVGEPGEDYQCRCYAEPYFKNLLEEETE